MTSYFRMENDLFGIDMMVYTTVSQTFRHWGLDCGKNIPAGDYVVLEWFYLQIGPIEQGKSIRV